MPKGISDFVLSPKYINRFLGWGRKGLFVDLEVGDDWRCLAKLENQSERPCKHSDMHVAACRMFD